MIGVCPVRGRGRRRIVQILPSQSTNCWVGPGDQVWQGLSLETRLQAVEAGGQVPNVGPVETPESELGEGVGHVWHIWPGKNANLLGEGVGQVSYILSGERANPLPFLIPDKFLILRIYKTCCTDGWADCCAIITKQPRDDAGVGVFGQYATLVPAKSAAGQPVHGRPLQRTTQQPVWVFPRATPPLDGRRSVGSAPPRPGAGVRRPRGPTARRNWAPAAARSRKRRRGSGVCDGKNCVSGGAGLVGHLRFTPAG